MTRFLFIHGGRNGSWVWKAVRRKLDADGLPSIAPDVPMHDAAAGLGDWVAGIVASTPSAEGEIVVVGHSLGGLVLPSLAEALPVRRLIYLAASVPQPGMAYGDYLRTPEGRTAILIPYASGSTEGRLPWPIARDHLFADCPKREAWAAWRRFRPLALTAFAEPSGIEHWPATPTTFLVMTEDRCVNPTWSRRMARRMGADVLERRGGHSPWLADPTGLAGALAAVA